MIYNAIRIRNDHYKILEDEKEKQERSMAYLVGKAVEQTYRPPGNPQLKKKAAHPDFAIFKQLYLEAYKAWNGYDYLGWNVIQAKALNGVISKCEQLLEASDHDIISMWNAILQKMPQFYKGKSLNAINNNLNGIINEIRTGPHGRGTVSQKYL